MLTVKTQIARHIKKLVKKIQPTAEVKHEGMTCGVIFYKSSPERFFNDCKAYYKYDNSSTTFDLYRLIIELDIEGGMYQLNGSMLTIKE
jgi:hypothetical protein